MLLTMSDSLSAHTYHTCKELGNKSSSTAGTRASRRNPCGERQIPHRMHWGSGLNSGCGNGEMASLLSMPLRHPNVRHANTNFEQNWLKQPIECNWSLNMMEAGLEETPKLFTAEFYDVNTAFSRPWGPVIFELRYSLLDFLSVRSGSKAGPYRLLQDGVRVAVTVEKVFAVFIPPGVDCLSVPDEFIPFPLSQWSRARSVCNADGSYNTETGLLWLLASC